MTLDLSISDEPDFFIELGKCGKIYIHRLTVGRLKKLEFGEDTVAHQFVNNLLRIVGRRETGEALGDADIEAISDDEREGFARTFLNHHPYLKTSEGDLNLDEGQSYSNSLLQAIRLYCAKSFNFSLPNSIQNLLKAHKSLLTPAFVSAIKTSKRTSSHLDDLIKKMRTDSEYSQGAYLSKGESPNLDDFAPVLKSPTIDFDFPPLLQSANEQLGEVVERLNSLETLAVSVAATVQSVSDAATEFLVSFARAAQAADESSRRAIKLALIAIVASVLTSAGQIGYSEWRAGQEAVGTSAAIEIISQRIEEVVRVQTEASRNIENRMSGANNQIRVGLDRVANALNELIKIERSKGRGR